MSVVTEREMVENGMPLALKLGQLGGSRRQGVCALEKGACVQVAGK